MKYFTLLFILGLFLSINTTIKADPCKSGSVVIVMDSPIKEDPKSEEKKAKTSYSTNSDQFKEAKDCVQSPLIKKTKRPSQTNKVNSV